MSTTDTEHQHTGPWVRQGVDGRDYCQTCGPDWPGREHFPGGVYETTDTERDERLRGIQERTEVARDLLPPESINYSPTDDYLAHLADDADYLLAEVARLDAVVTAVREVAETLMPLDRHNVLRAPDGA